LTLIFLIISLGIAQSIIGPTFLNPTHQAEDLRLLSGLYRVSPITGQIAYRPTSVFVSAGRYADFTIVAWLLVLGFSGYLLLRQKKGRFMAFTAVAVTAAGAFLTASRGALLWALINGTATLVAFVWGAPWREGEALRAFRVIQRAVVGVALGIALLFITYPEALLSRVAIYQETLDPSSSTTELGNRTWDYPVENFLGAFNYPNWPTGYGIGTTALGGQYVARFFNVKPPVIGVESGFGTLIVEMGIAGLALWLVMAVAILLAAWRVVKKLRGSPLFPVGFVIFWYSFVLLFPSTFAGIQPYEDYLLNAYFWLLLGILFRLPTIKLAALPAGTSPRLQTSPRGFR
jgi:O-antigen ligase